MSADQRQQAEPAGAEASAPAEPEMVEGAPVDAGAQPEPAPTTTSPDEAPVAEPAAPEGEPAAGEGDADEAVAALERERDEWRERAARKQADFDNYRKRARRDALEAEGRGLARLARELLPALDNLDRALAAAQAGDGAPDPELVRGFELVKEELRSAFGRAGIEAFSPEGEPFDPTVHEALAQQPVEGAEPGTVVEVYQLGYRYDGTILRPARVVVAG
jgi:molecular chaperone GrpE